jgi:hypothetical protein
VKKNELPLRKQTRVGNFEKLNLITVGGGEQMRTIYGDGGDRIFGD